MGDKEGNQIYHDTDRFVILPGKFIKHSESILTRMILLGKE